MTTVFVGEIEGTPFIAAHTLVSEEQRQVVPVLDSLAEEQTRQPIEFTKGGWVIKRASPDICPEAVDSSLGEIPAKAEFVGTVPREEVAAFVGSEALVSVLYALHKPLPNMPQPEIEEPDSILSIAR